MPLGESEAGLVFLARGEPPLPTLLRLKTWRQAAPADFRERFQNLTAALATWPEPAITALLAAWVDDDGRAAVLTEFRTGVPLLGAVASGSLQPSMAAVHLAQVREVTLRAHARDLAHGSIRPGNVFIDRRGTPYLLDFGLAPLLTPPAGERDWAFDDLAGLADLDARLQLFRSTGPCS